MSEFRVPPARKKKFSYYFKDGTIVYHTGYFYWESQDYRRLRYLGLEKITYSYDYKDDL